MMSLYNILFSLQECGDPTGHSVLDIPEVENHKIGIKNNCPLFFIKTQDNKSNNVLDQTFELISIRYNRLCRLFCDNKLIDEGSYTIIMLKSDATEIQRYFIDIISLAIKTLNSEPTIHEIRDEINKLVELFQCFTKPAVKTIQGVWAEMLLIAQAANTDYLVEAWHNIPSAKFDFNDGRDKIEVKCTTKDRRLHRFSLGQLQSTASSRIVVASILTQETGIGVSLFDLRDKIFNSLINKELVSRVDQILSKTLGQDIEKAVDYCYDFNMAIDTLAFYNSIHVPKIESPIPLQVSNIQFDSDLTDIPNINLNSFNSRLFNSIIII